MAARLNNFSAKYLCESQNSKRDLSLIKLAKKYHETCEAYDRKVCTGPVVRGEIQPGNREEWVLINRNALQVRKEFIAKGDAMGLDANEVCRAISCWQG